MAEVYPTLNSGASRRSAITLIKALCFFIIVPDPYIQLSLIA